MDDFYGLSPEQQADRLALLARQALKHWDLTPVSISLIKYRENAVFKITTADNTFALRIHRPGYHSSAALRSELQWMAALDDAGIAVPKVIPTTDGQLLVSVQTDAVPEPRCVDLFAWISGEQLGSVEHGLGKDSASIRSTYRQIGQIAAQLHNQASQWSLPDGFERHAWDAEGLVGEQPFWGRFWELPQLTPDQRELLLQARDKVRNVLSALEKSSRNYSLIHADFVPENLMTDGDAVRLLDFDDAGFGWHMFELATALYFVLREPDYDIARTALTEGYCQLRPLTEDDLGLLETFLTARGFTYLGWIQDRQETETARQLTADLIARACHQSRRYLGLS
ncbi:phosphotransferase enzyme family protein [Aliamphritea hakodatensis]|uniref:phosphotransferase enzyme family protein n=1 Tax=Aliamphritea hakodatensis TaxID=2895352 RepID=UPI0022FD5A07|nr:phosphotransferase [Aliamphritea hakodatensis]